MLTKEQKAFRKTCLGGSSVAAAIGLHPWQSAMEVWAQHVLETDLQTERPVMRLGSFLEPFVLNELLLQGYEIGDGSSCLRHPAHHFMGANTDGTVKLDGAWGVLEIKSMSPRKWWQCRKEKAPPLHYQIQCQHYMACTGLPFALLVALNRDTGEIDTYLLERNDRFIEGRLIPAARELWECIENKTPPAWDGSESCERALRAIYPEPEPDSVIAMPECASTADALEAANGTKREADKLARELRNELRAMLKEGERGDLGDGRYIKRRKVGRGETIEVKEWK